MAKTKKNLVGDEEGNLAELLNEVKRGLGGSIGIAQYLINFIKDPNANSYVRSKCFGLLNRMMEKVDALGTSEATLSDEDLEEEIRVGIVRYLVVMPVEEYEATLATVGEKRAAFAAREAKARLALEDTLRPIGAPPGIERVS